MYKTSKSVQFFFSLLMLAAHPSVFGMEDPEQDELRFFRAKSYQQGKEPELERDEKAVLLALGRLSYPGTLSEGERGVSKFSGLPANPLILVTKELMKSDCYSNESKARIVFSLINFKKFRDRKELCIHAMYEGVKENSNEILFFVEPNFILRYPQGTIDLCIQTARGLVKGFDLARLKRKDCENLIQNSRASLKKAISSYYENGKNLDEITLLAQMGLDFIDIGSKDRNAALRYICGKTQEEADLNKGIVLLEKILPHQPKLICNALMESCTQGNGSIGIINFLLRKHPEYINYQAQDGLTPLIVACSQGDKAVKVVKILLERGANPSMACKIESILTSQNLGSAKRATLNLDNGEMPSMGVRKLTEEGMARIKKMLEGKQGKPLWLGSCKKMPLMYSCDQGDKAYGVVVMLLNAGVDINAQDDEGQTPLMIASSLRGGHELTKLLITKRANRGLKDKDGKTALERHLDSPNPNEGIAMLLRGEH